jgi:hypothetical protein
MFPVAQQIQAARYYANRNNSADYRIHKQRVVRLEHHNRAAHCAHNQRAVYIFYPENHVPHFAAARRHNAKYSQCKNQRHKLRCFFQFAVHEPSQIIAV